GRRVRTSRVRWWRSTQATSTTTSAGASTFPSAPTGTTTRLDAARPAAVAAEPAGGGRRFRQPRRLAARTGRRAEGRAAVRAGARVRPGPHGGVARLIMISHDG